MVRKTLARNAPDLHVHSTFSLLDGFGTPEEVVLRAKGLGWGAACLTEHGWMGSVPAFYQACRKHKIKPILGCEMYVVPDALLGEKTKEYRGASRHLTVIALSREGYQNLLAWNDEGMQRDNFYFRPRMSIERMIEVAPNSLHHNVVLSGCLGGELCTAILENNGHSHGAGLAYVNGMKSVFPNFYVEIQNHRLDKFVGRGLIGYEALLKRETKAKTLLLRLADQTNTPVVITNDSHFQTSDQRKAHISMMASKMKRWSTEDTHHGDSQEHQSKAYAREYGYWANYMRSMEEIEDATAGVSGACENVLDIVREADIRLDPLDNFTYSIPFSGHDDPMGKIRSRSKSRLVGLVRKHGSIARERFEHELKAMGDFAHYLLIMSDLIIHARESGILTNTRGSAANSIVCYCLKIHDIDSIHYKLTFERFVNPERKKLPDIDIDIEFDRYEDFMKYVHEYMEEREGEDQVAQICNYGTMANRSTFRMVAESLGIEKEIQDEISNLLPQMIDSGLVDEEDDVYAALKENYPEIYELAEGIFDSIKSVGQHACGWVFGTRDRPISEWIPLYLIASSGRLVTQYDYKQIEKFGLNKGDFLRLKTLSVLSRCLKSIGKNPMDLEQIPLDDEKTFEMLRAGHTEGVFTLQGKTNRQGVMEIEAANEHNLIASVAIYRPALTRPGYHTVYNKRRRGEEKIRYPHKLAEDVLGETYGLPIFQEQILDLGYAVGMDHNGAQELLDAIKLAKGVGRGAKEAFSKVQPLFISTAIKKKGLTKDEAHSVWELISNFEGYGFNRGHATSYGLLADRAAYLKAHYPQEFYAALLDVYPEKHKYVASARADGFRLIAPSVNKSGAGFSRGDDKKSLRVGLTRVDGLGPVAVRALLQGQPFRSIEDLRERIPPRSLNSRGLENLGAVGALSEFGVKATDDDTQMYNLLGFLIDTPRAMKGIKIDKAYTKRRVSDSWTHIGYEKGADLTDLRASCSKMFWIPELPSEKLLKLKASQWARVKTWLLLVIDENGLPFQIMANENKEAEVEYVKWMAKRCKGAVICMEGSIRKSFDNDGPLGFRLFDVTGTFQGQPQVFGVKDERWVKAFNVLHKRKKMARKSKG